MHKTTAKNLRFGCGASLQSGFLSGYAHDARMHIELQKINAAAKAASRSNRVRGRKK